MYLPILFERVVPSSRKRPIKNLADFVEDILPLKSRRLSSQPKKDSNLFAKINVEGFSQDELKVSVDGSELIIEGKHSECDEKIGSFEKSFTRKIPIPEDIEQQTLKSDLSPEGKYLLIRANRKQPEPPKRITIPIGIKSSSPSPTSSVNENVNAKNGCTCNIEKQNTTEKAETVVKNLSNLTNEKSHEAIVV